MRLNLLLISIGLLLGSIYASEEDVFWSEIESEYLANGNMINEHLDINSVKSEEFARNAAFSCPTNLKSESQPTSVHKLKPGDIEVVGAIGDSLTAANAARSVTPIGIAQQFRGISWSIGGENPDIKKLVTLPNILKQYNPNLFGYSTGTGLAGTPQSGFNESKPGTTSYQMPDQAKSLVERMRKSDKVDFENGWKLVTLFIGGNDLCWTCHTAKFNAESYVQNIKEALDYFHQNLPRTFVNLVSTLDVTGVEPLEGITCRAMQKFMCSCGLDKSWRNQIKTITANMQKGLEDLVNSGRYDTHDNFTVVLQPVFTKMSPPTDSKGNVDYSYFGPDCFHLSAKGHAAAAVELWNSMISPVGNKPDRWQMLGKRIPCPKNEFLYTNKNSVAEPTSSN